MERNSFSATLHGISSYNNELEWASHKGSCHAKRINGMLLADLFIQIASEGVGEKEIFYILKHKFSRLSDAGVGVISYISKNGTVMSIEKADKVPRHKDAMMTASVDPCIINRDISNTLHYMEELSRVQQIWEMTLLISLDNMDPSKYFGGKPFEDHLHFHSHCCGIAMKEEAREQDQRERAELERRLREKDEAGTRKDVVIDCVSDVKDYEFIEPKLTRKQEEEAMRRSEAEQQKDLLPTLREVSRQEYLKMREQKKLDELRDDLEDEQYLFDGVKVTAKEEQEMRMYCRNFIIMELDYSTCTDFIATYGTLIVAVQDDLLNLHVPSAIDRLHWEILRTHWKLSANGSMLLSGAM
eukprot:Gb_40353 [translate_table: standard]